MAENAANDINYFLLLDQSEESVLGTIRHWENLKIAFEGNQVWLKDFTKAQIDSIEVKSMPYKTVFDLKNGKLFLHDSLLPDRNPPSLLWTNISRGLTVDIPSLNHNFFALEQEIKPSLNPSEAEQESVALWVSLKQLGKYIETAPAVRLQRLQWIILNETEALLLGQPLIPLSGKSYWKKDFSLIPAGYDFEYQNLFPVLQQKINPDRKNWILWDTEAKYTLLPKSAFQGLSIGSFRRSV